MIRTQEHSEPPMQTGRNEPQPQPTQTGRTDRHPAWRKRCWCTAHPTTQADDYRSVPVRLDLTCAFAVPARAGEAHLTRTAAPWPCSTYLRVRDADAELSMPVGYAAPQVSALPMLAMTGQAGEEV